MYEQDNKQDHAVVRIYKQTPMVVRMLICGIVILLLAMIALICWKFFKSAGGKKLILTPDTGMDTLPDMKMTIPSLKSASASPKQVPEIHNKIMEFARNFIK